MITQITYYVLRKWTIVFGRIGRKWANMMKSTHIVCNRTNTRPMIRWSNIKANMNCGIFQCRRCRIVADFRNCHLQRKKIAAHSLRLNSRSTNTVDRNRRRTYLRQQQQKCAKKCLRFVKLLRNSNSLTTLESPLDYGIVSPRWKNKKHRERQRVWGMYNNLSIIKSFFFLSFIRATLSPSQRKDNNLLFIYVK